MNRGVIVVGYQGIGKSTLAEQDLHFLDLESSSFYSGGDRIDDWWYYYCTIAINLARQGHVVFVSSHREVREYLSYVSLPPFVHVMCCVPAEHLKDAWIDRLYQRWMQSNLEKDYRAWKNAEDRFTENVQEIKQNFDIICEIGSTEYNLKDLLQRCFTLNSFGIYT